MRTFRLIISSSTSVLFNGNAEYCRVESDDGSLAFEARHEPVVVLLKKNSEIEYRDESGARASIPVPDGILDFSVNRCLVTLGQALEDTEPSA